MPRRAYLTALLLLLAASANCRAGLIINGGFESPAAASPFETMTGSQLTGWTVTSGSVDLINGYWPASEGQQSIDLAGSTRDGGTIEQAFATTPGASYVLTFDYANNIDVSTATANVSVFGASAAALLDQGLSHSGSGKAAMGYTAFSAVFTADSSLTTLRFTSTGPDPVVNGSNGVALDNVAVVQAVPAPPTALLLAPAALGLLAAGSAGAVRRGREPRSRVVAPAPPSWAVARPREHPAKSGAGRPGRDVNVR